jgi:hypothetical protein
MQCSQWIWTVWWRSNDPNFIIWVLMFINKNSILNFGSSDLNLRWWLLDDCTTVITARQHLTPVQGFGLNYYNFRWIKKERNILSIILITIDNANIVKLNINVHPNSNLIHYYSCMCEFNVAYHFIYKQKEKKTF